jgi:glutaredoxin 3
MYIILGRPNCPFCDKARELLASKGLEYTYVNVKHPDNKEWLDFLKSNGVTTVPQIFELLPGGYEGLFADLEMKND